jgi:outer membrane receptor for ferrienterochelin and colicins
MIRGRLRPLAAALAVTTLASVTVPARADGTADEADLHFRMGGEDFRRGNYSDALAHFLLSNRLAPNRNVIFNIASTYEQLKRYPDAYRYYTEALEGETNARVVQDLKASIARIGPYVAVIAVETTPPGATIYVDRKDLGSRGRAPRVLAMGTGKYRILAELEGYEPATSEIVDAKQGATTQVTLALRRIEGTVHVALEGGKASVVRVDDERGPPACTTPCDLRLLPGRHELYFSAEGFQAAPRSVTVIAGQKTSLTAALVPLTGTLVVNADERDALITVDGRRMGFTPSVIPAVPAGARKVRVSLRGYAPIETTVEVKPNQQAELEGLKLQPLNEVTAVSRYAESLEDAPSSVTVIDGRELRAFGYPTIAAALRGVRGVTITNDRAYNSASIRGIGQPGDYGNRLLVLSDGAALNDNLLNSSYIGSDGRADLHDVERIEIVRGPGSLLYGAGALSGVVNLATRPRDEPSSVHGNFGVYDNRTIHGRAGFHYNLAPDKGIWASVSTAYSAGLDVPVALKDPIAEGGQAPLSPEGKALRTANAVDAFRSIGTAGRAWVGPVTAQWFYHRRLQVIPAGAYATTFNDPRTAWTDTRMMAEIRYEPRFGKYVELMTRVHGNRYLFHGEYQLPSEKNVEDFAGSWVGAEARVAVKPVSWLRITGGVEGQLHPEATLEGRTIEVPNGKTKCHELEGGIDSCYLNEHDPYRFAAGYALVEGSPARWFRFSGGARVDVYSTFGPIVVPRAALIFKPVKGSALKIMGGRAFRAPSIYEQVYNDNGFSEVRSVDPKKGWSLGPESVYSGEIEYSHRFLEDWVALAAGHADYVQGLIQSTPIAPNTEVTRYANSPSPVLSVGGDVEIRRDFRRGWMLSAMYGYQRVQFLDTRARNPLLVNAPEHLASLKGVAPLFREIASLGLRLTLEAPRRIDGLRDDVTRPALIADATVSGVVRDYGLRYTLGVYNVADWRHQVPVHDTFQSRTMTQNGRTILLDLMVTYP